jgi:hypothetical protein
MSCPDRYPRGVGSPPMEGRPGSHQIPDRLPIDASGDGRPHPSQRAEWGLPTNLGQQPEQARGRGLRMDGDRESRARRPAPAGSCPPA